MVLIVIRLTGSFVLLELTIYVSQFLTPSDFLKYFTAGLMTFFVAAGHPAPATTPAHGGKQAAGAVFGTF